VSSLHPRTEDGLSEFPSVPKGTFRCDVCTFIQPIVYLCGTVIDSADDPPNTYSLCGTCALWLGIGTSRLQRRQIFNFSDKQFEKVQALKKELKAYGSNTGLSKNITDLSNEAVEIIQTTDNLDETLGKIRNHLDETPNLRSLIKLRLSHMPITHIALSDRLTNGEFVQPGEIKKANRRSFLKGHRNI